MNIKRFKDPKSGPPSTRESRNMGGKKNMGGKWARKKSAHVFFLKKMGHIKKTWAHNGRIIFKIKSRIPSLTSTLGRVGADPHPIKAWYEVPRLTK